jgi:DNA-binding MarR family transcriptional regulator
LLERAHNPRHARADLMRLTVRGASTYEAATRRQVPWANEAAHGIPMRDLAAAVRVLTTMSERLFRRSSQRTESRRQRAKKA